MDIKQTEISKETKGPLYKDWADPSVDEIVRGELAAIETYRETIEYLNSEKYFAETLDDIKESHKSAVLYWKTQSRIHDHIPQEGSGLWGVMVGGMLSLSKMGGIKAVLALLLEGEEHGLEMYRNKLDDDRITSEQKGDVKSIFIPNQKKNIQIIENLISQFNSDKRG